jgi:hypothetical protein
VAPDEARRKLKYQLQIGIGALCRHRETHQPEAELIGHRGRLLHFRNDPGHRRRRYGRLPQEPIHPCREHRLGLAPG